MGPLKLLMNKKMLMTASVVCLLAVISYGFVYLAFSTALKERSHELLNRKQEVGEAKLLFSQKDSYEKEWETVKSTIKTESQDQDQVLNLWVKDLLTHASLEGITFAKLEPQGIKKGERGEEMRLYLEFQGDIRKLVRFIYHLIEKDPLSKINAFSLKKEDSDKNYAYQLTLGKTLL